MSRSPNPRFLPVFSLILAGAAAIRALHLVEHARNLPLLHHPVLDARLYHLWAASLARGEGPPPAPYYHAPGFPQILALVYGFFGVHAAAAVVFQSLLGVATTGLVALLARRLFGTAEAVVAAGLFLAYGPVYFFEAKLLAATLSVFLAVLVVFLCVHVQTAPARGSRRGWAVLAVLGLAAGLLAVVRANLGLMALLLLCVFAVRAAKGTLPRRVPLVFAGAALLAVLPAALHNLSHGAAVPVATNGGFNFYSGNVRGAQGIYADVSGMSGTIRTQEAEADSLVRADLGRSLSPGAASRYWFRKGLDRIAADPAGWLRLEAKKALLLVQREPVTVNGSWRLEAEHVPLYRLAAVPFNLLCVLGLFGLVLSGSARTAAAPRTGAVVLLVSVLVSGLLFFVMERLRLPAVPVLAVFAAHALVAGVRGWRWGSRKPVAAAAAVAAAFTAATWVSPLSATRDPRWESNFLLQVGNQAGEEGNRDRALRAYRLAEGADPTALAPLRAQSQIGVERGDLDLVLRSLERAAAVAPGDAAVRNNLGIAYFTAGNLDACLREMEAASGLAPEWGVPLYYQGLVLRRRGDPAAQERLVEALDRDPRIGGAYLQLIELSLEEGRPEAAREWMNRAAANGVTVPPALRARVP